FLVLCFASSAFLDISLLFIASIFIKISLLLNSGFSEALIGHMPLFIRIFNAFLVIPFLIAFFAIDEYLVSLFLLGVYIAFFLLQPRYRILLSKFHPSIPFFSAISYSSGVM